MPNRITEARKLANLSQRELAERMELAPPTVSGYESGKYDPKSDGLVKIATICGVTVDYLLGLTDDPHSRFQVEITDAREDILLKKFRQLNDAGKVKLSNYADDLLATTIYRERDGSNG